MLARSSRLRLALAALVLSFCGTMPAMSQSCPPPTPAEAEAVGRTYFDAFNSGDRAALDRLLAADYRHAGAVVEKQDRAVHLDRMGAVRTGFPDGVYTIDWMLVDGDTVAIRNRFVGTHRGAFAGVAASGRPVSVGAFHVHRIACGKIAETWNAGDGIGLMRQMGAIPGPPTTPAGEEAKPAAAATPTTCPASTPAQNEAAARRWYDEALNQGRFDVLDEILAEDVVHHAGVMIDMVGRERTGGSLKAIRAGFPDIRYTVDDVLASGDRVLIRWTGRGTHRGDFLGVKASGAGVDWSGMNAFRFRCGKIVEGWSEANGLAILRQIGGLK